MALISGFHFAFHVICALSENLCIPPHPPVKPEPPPESAYQLLQQQPSAAGGGGGGGGGATTKFDYYYGDFPSSDPITATEHGWLEGYYMKSIRNRTFSAFEGVRYAQPPVGRLRFSSPRPLLRAGVWSGVRSAKKFGNMCLQMDTTQYYRIMGYEDCLFLNVYSPRLSFQSDFYGHNKGQPPELEPNSLLPVLVFIHGGAHMFGTAQFYGPTYLMDSGRLIFISINYRLGVLGYFSTGDQHAYGNFGLKDQALALKWVQENVHHFGGDKNRITILGQSAGASAVGLHLISEQTRDIPVGAIMHSGDALCSFALINRTQSNSFKLAKALGCPVDDDGCSGSHSNMMQCMRRQNPHFIVEGQIRLYEALRYPFISFGPVVEPEHSGAFLVETPKLAYARGHVSSAPVLSGLVENDGEFFAAMAYVQLLLGPTNREYNKMLPLALSLSSLPLHNDDGGHQRQSSEAFEKVGHKIDDFYFNGRNASLSFATRHRLGQLVGDRLFTTGFRQGIALSSKVRPTYAFYFSHIGKHSVVETLGLRREDWGVVHVDDLQYLMNSTQYFHPQQSSNRLDFDLMDFMLNVWTNFVEKQRPVFTKPKSKKQRSSSGAEEGEEIDFWELVTAEADDESDSGGGGGGGAPPRMIDLNNKFGNILRKPPSMITFPLEKNYQFWRSLENLEGVV